MIRRPASRALDRAAAELRHALTEIGFYTIINHGVPWALVHEVYRQVAQFRARPLDEKLRSKLDKHNVDYLPMIQIRRPAAAWLSSLAQRLFRSVQIGSFCSPAQTL